MVVSSGLVALIVSSLLSVGADIDFDEDGSSICHERQMNPIAYLCNSTSSDCVSAFDGKTETFYSGPVLMVMDFNVHCFVSRPDTVDLAGRITTVGSDYLSRKSRRS